MDILLDTVANLRQQHILVLGDLILDRYTWGSAERVSPEAPTVVLRVDHVEVRLGGAAAVAALLRGLGATVTLAGVVGADGSGTIIQKLLDDAGIDARHALVDASRPTTVKDRFLGCSPHRTPHQILRVDQESTQPLDDRLTQTMIKGVQESLTQSAALLVSDYAKGVCRPSLLRQSIDAASALELPVIVDPARGGDFRHYGGATVIKPNRVEAELATRQPIRSLETAKHVALALMAHASARAVVLTLDRDGLLMVDADGDVREFPTVVQEVTDITGAGDTVVALLGLTLANQIPLHLGVQLANVAAAWQVRHVGIAPITLDDLRGQLANASLPTKILPLEQLTLRVRDHRRHGRRVVLTNGCFDLLHVGHVTYLQAARRFGDVLIVAINSDRSVRANKGPQRPVIAEQDRAAMLAALGCVDHVLIFDDPTPHQLLAAIRPDVLVKGGDYALNQVVGREIVEAYGGQVHVTEHVPGISTSKVLERVVMRNS